MSDGAEAVIIKYDDGRMGYVQYTIQVHLGEAPWQIHRRFNDFLPLNDALHKAYSRFSAPLPPKRWFGRCAPVPVSASRRYPHAQSITPCCHDAQVQP
jgi:hypothetical protein